MQRRHFLHLSATAAASALTLYAPGAHAQAWPDRTIKILQGFAPGGNADNIARAVSAEMAKGIGQAFVVEAQAGAGGTIAAATVARSKPDGYTLLLATGGHAVAGAIYNSLPYRTVQDFEMVGTITYFPFLVVTTADSKVPSLSALLTNARANPGKVAYGTAGIGSTHHLAGELLASMSKTQLLHVPYRGDSASLTALLAGDVPFIIAPPTAVLANIKAGKLRALAATGPQRWPGLPDVPTVAEQGVTGYDVRSWAGLMAPAGTPRPVIDRLNREINQALALPDVITTLGRQALDPAPTTVDDFNRILQVDFEKYGRLIALTGARVE